MICTSSFQSKIILTKFAFNIYMYSNKEYMSYYLRQVRVKYQHSK